MASTDRAILDHLGRIATELGPMLAPAGQGELLEAIADTAREMFSAGACSIALLDAAEEQLVFHVAAGGGDVLGIRVPVGEGVAGWVVASGQPIVIADVSADPRFARDVAEQTGYIPTSIMAMPLETAREMLGVIEVLDPQRDDLQLLALFARQAALAIESEAVFRDLGRVLFAAAAEAAGEDAVGEQLRRLAREPAPERELSSLAAAVSELMSLGSAEQKTALGLIETFLAYARSRRT